MFIHLLSDVHNEFNRTELKKHLKRLYDEYATNNSDLWELLKKTVLVLAGDFCELRHPELRELVNWLSEIYHAVIYVPGNHEYYGCSIEAGNIIFASLKANNVFPLLNEAVDIDGVRFIGTTLWFRDDYNHNKKRALNDFNWIEDADERIPKENQLALHFLEQNLTKNDFLITHHLPSSLCVAGSYVGSSYNCFYVCPIDELIEDRKPIQVVHGHSHEPSDAVIGTSPVMSNPMDYPQFFHHWPRSAAFMTFIEIEVNEDGTLINKGTFKKEWRPVAVSEEEAKDLEQFMEDISPFIL